MYPNSSVELGATPYLNIRHWHTNIQGTYIPAARISKHQLLTMVVAFYPEIHSIFPDCRGLDSKYDERRCLDR